MDQVRKRPAWLRALGSEDPPAIVSVGGVSYRCANVLKHDSWAATALYEDEGDQRIICKFGRQQPAFGIPLGWLGRALVRREVFFLKRLTNIAQVPDELGPVSVNGKTLPYALARTFVDGEPFRTADQVDAAFFASLRALLDDIHASGMAYVDLHKRENIIVSRDRVPFIIDFQVSLSIGPRWPASGLLRRHLVTWLQEVDDFNYRKHLARCLPHLLTPEQVETYLRPPVMIRVHRAFAVPLRSARRQLLVWLAVRDPSGHASSEAEPEHALRQKRQRPPEDPEAAQ